MVGSKGSPGMPSRAVLLAMIVAASGTTVGVLSAMPGCACAPGVPPRDEPLSDDGGTEMPSTAEASTGSRDVAPSGTAFLRDVLRSARSAPRPLCW